MPSCCHTFPKRNLLMPFYHTMLPYSGSKDVNWPTQWRWKEADKPLTASKELSPPKSKEVWQKASKARWLWCYCCTWCCNQIERTEISNRWWWVCTNFITIKTAKKRLRAKVCIAHCRKFELLLKCYSSVTFIPCMLCVYKMQELLKLKMTCFPTLEMLSIFFGTCYVMTMDHIRTLQSSQTSRKHTLMLH